MRNRDYKTFQKDEYYHIYNRGNQKQNIFLDESDYKNFLKRCCLVLGIENIQTPNALNIHPLPKDCLKIICYCLMPNHFHFIIRQDSDIEINRFISKLCTSYASYFNKKYKLVGHLFQDAFKAKCIDNDEYITYLSAYIHNNPNNPYSYQFSSFKGIIESNDPLCKDRIILNWFNHNPDEYKNFVLNFNQDNRSFFEHLLFDE